MSPSPALHSVPRRTFLRQSAAAILLPALNVRATFAAEEKQFGAADFISVQKGDLPIIISAPHGGTTAIPGVPERKGEGMKTGGAGFFAGREENTELLAAAIAREIQSRLGKKPFFVIAKAHRKFVDANRPPEIGVEHPRAREVSDAYRGTLAKLSSAAHTTARPTRCSRRSPAGKIHADPQSLAGLLVARGIHMKPTDTIAENAGFTDGDIIRGSGKHEGIGPVQCEFGMDFRTNDALKGTSEKFADATADFAKLYLLGKGDGKK